MSKIIENYCLNEVLGVGQYGKVYKALSIHTNQTFAIKVVKKQKFDEVEKLEEFTRNEIQTLAKMDCPNIVKFIEMLKTANHYYFVYEYCNGGTLESLLKVKGHFYETEALVIFSQLVNAYKFLNRELILHRDLKPANILLHKDQVKLADFGFCRSLATEKDMAKTMVGSPIYMAPEVLFGKDYSINAEIWSLGCVLYEMLFGECPYEESSIAALILRLEKDTKGVIFKREKNPISIQTENLIRRMVVVNPANRMTFKELFEVEFIKKYYPNNNDEFDFMKFSRITNLNNNNNESRNDNQFKINRKKNDRALKHLFHERNKIYFLYQVLHDVLSLDCSGYTPMVSFLLMKMIRNRGKLMKANLVETLNPSAFPHFRKLLENWDLIKTSFEYKSYSGLLSKEIDLIEKQYPVFKGEAEKNLIYQSDPSLILEIKDLINFDYPDPKRINDFLIFYVDDIKKLHFNNPLELRDNPNELKYLWHMNDVLDLMGLDDFFENVLDIYVKFEDQKYFEMIKKYSKDHLVNIVNHKLLARKNSGEKRQF